MSASSAVTIVADDEDGGAVCTVELSPAGPGFVTPDDRGVLAHTNHFLAAPGQQADDDGAARARPVLRLDHARRAWRGAAGTIDESTRSVRDASHRGGSERDLLPPRPDAAFGDRWATLATMVTEPALAAECGPRRRPVQPAAAPAGAAARQSLSRHGSAAS